MQRAKKVLDEEAMLDAEAALWGNLLLRGMSGVNTRLVDGTIEVRLPADVEKRAGEVPAVWDGVPVRMAAR